ncbi:MAG: hypothetical protein JXA57_02870 [Armatimonadetes bacterium]|nr:hypothetical protein [Armatimonadota bacterium]
MNKRPAPLILVAALWLLMGVFLLIANAMDLARFLSQGVVPGASPVLLVGMAIGGVVVSIIGILGALGLLWMDPRARGLLEIATWAVLVGTLTTIGSMVSDSIGGVGVNTAGILLSVGVVLVNIPILILLAVILVLLRGRTVRAALGPA